MRDSVLSSGPSLALVEDSDSALMTSTVEGSEAALTLLFRRYARLVRTVSYRIRRDEAETDDLLQEVFLFIQRRGEAYNPAKSPVRACWPTNGRLTAAGT